MLTLKSGSGGSNTNTISTIDNSSRLSAASTAPSSTHETNPNEDWKSPHDKPLHDIPMPPVLKASNAFSLKNAGRTLSWGRNKPATPSPSLKPQDHSQSPGGSTSQIEGESSGRQRNFTASSYASTATPPRLEERDLGFTLGEGFDSDMFAGIGKRKSAILEGEDLRGMSASPVSNFRSVTGGMQSDPGAGILSFQTNAAASSTVISFASITFAH